MWWLLRWLILGPPPKPVKRPTCTDYGCSALRFESCSDGRCRYHCQMYCKCVAEVKPVPFTVWNGGKGKKPTA